MSEMVERVARAMCDHAYSDIEIKRGWDGETRGSQVKWCAMARAAIEAMREPSQGMVNAATASDFGPGPGEFLLMWEAGIDEALK
jgi:hypothetical protein